MLNDFDLIVRRFPSEITIYPVADVHYGTLEHAQSEWESFVRKVEADPNAYLILDGDLVNNSIRTSVANPFDEVCRPREQKERMVEYLRPLKDRILCAVSGNHEYRTTKETDQDLTYDIMARLGLEDLYRPNIAFLKLSLGSRTDNGMEHSQQSYAFAVTHGAGGGIYTGATVNRNERFGNVIEGLDCLIVAHTHKGTVSRPSKIVIDMKNNSVKTKETLVLSTVSWLNFGGYAARKMLLPATSSKPQKLRLSDNKNCKQIEVVW